jgi:hypothetical protein
LTSLRGSESTSATVQPRERSSLASARLSEWLPTSTEVTVAGHEPGQRAGDEADDDAGQGERHQLRRQRPGIDVGARAPDPLQHQVGEDGADRVDHQPFGEQDRAHLARRHHVAQQRHG